MADSAQTISILWSSGVDEVAVSMRVSGCEMFILPTHAATSLDILAPVAEETLQAWAELWKISSEARVEKLNPDPRFCVWMHSTIHAAAHPSCVEAGATPQVSPATRPSEVFSHTSSATCAKYELGDTILSYDVPSKSPERKTER